MAASLTACVQHERAKGKHPHMTSSSHRWRARAIRIGAPCLFALVIAGRTAAAGPSGDTPVRKTITVGTRTVKLTLAVPRGAPSPPAFLVLFASGDGGLKGVSGEL